MRTRVTAACFLLLPALSFGQSLGEAARKERERRAKLREAGAAAQPITEKDLANSKGALANDPNEAARPDDGSTGTKGSAVAIRGGGVGTERSTDAEAYWRRRVAQARARVAEAQAKHDALQRMIRVGQPAMYDANGKRVIYSVYQMKERADAAAAELAETQKALEDLLEEARRAGALPGWLR